MSQLIQPTLTVKEINLKYPGCRDVFNRYGMGGCGGAFGPPEPLFFFAAAHHVPLAQMMSELEVSAQKEATKSTGETEGEKSMNHLYKLFIGAGLLFTLTFGTVWGVINLTQIALYHSFQAPAYSTTQAHGHAQTWGWVGLFIMGVSYYAVTKFKNVPMKHFKLGYASFYLMAIGILIRAISQPLATTPLFKTLLLLSAIMELVSIGIYTGLMARTFKLSEYKMEFYEKYIHASIGWFAILGIVNFLLVLQLVVKNVTIIPLPWNNSYLHLQIFAFITNMIMGFSLRILPNFMGLREPKQKSANIAFVLYNLGVLWRCALVPYPFISAILEVSAVLVFIDALGIFTKPISKHSIIGVDHAYAWFIKVSYVWLLIAGLMILSGDIYKMVTGLEIEHAYVGAYRHAVTVGFITTLMLGVAYRILPIFNGTELYSNKLMRTSFWLILAGNFMRVFFQAGILIFGKWTYALMGSSGYIELIALSLFAYNISQTLRATTTSFIKDRVVQAQSKVAEILDVYPELKDSFINLGFSHLKNVDRVPGFVTLKFAAQRHGLDINQVIKSLNQLIQQKEKAA